MKRIVFIIIVLFIVVASMGFSDTRKGMAAGLAYQLDAEFLGGGALGNGLLFSFKIPKQPILFGLGFRVSAGSFNVSFTADWWLINKHIDSIFYWYLGPGFYLGAGTGHIGLGLRVPIGLQLFIIEPLELFIEAAPRFGLGISPLNFPEAGIMAAIGFRFWF